MNDERLGVDLSTWMKEAELPPPDSVQSAREVAGDLPQTPQLRRWRWLPASIGMRNAVEPIAEQTIPYQPTPVLASNGQARTVSGRTRSMFSPAKAITATALAVAVGSVLLIAQPLDQGGSGVPGVATDAEITPAVEVTGSFSRTGCRRSFEDEPGSEQTPAGSKDEYSCGGATVMSDARLSGSVTMLSDNVWFEGNGLEAADLLSSLCAVDGECDPTWLETRHVALSIENDDGVWHQRPRVELDYTGASRPTSRTVVLDGEDGYDGLVAVLEVSDSSDDGDSLDYYGFILDARHLEPVPEISSVN
jgi:hypothetical protein